jgi:hypothetical protein
MSLSVAETYSLGIEWITYYNVKMAYIPISISVLLESLYTKRISFLGKKYTGVEREL